MASNSIKKTMRAFRAGLLLAGITLLFAGSSLLPGHLVEGAGQKQNAPAGTADLSGTITYCPNGSSPATPNVTVTAQGAATFMTTTNASGAYLFDDIPTDTYTITASKPTFASPGGSGINTTDVSRILTHLADPPNSTLTNCQRRAADTSANGAINTTDVTNVLNFLALAAPTGTNHTGEWRFCKPPTTAPGGVCTHPDLVNLLASVSNENFDAILLGEVSGNLVPTGVTPIVTATHSATDNGASSSYSGASVQVSRKKVQAKGAFNPNVVSPITATLPTTTMVSPIGAGFQLPISISDVTPAAGQQVTGYILQFTYNSAVLGVQNPVFSTAGTLSSVIPDANIAANTAVPGVIRIVAVAPSGVSLTGSGKLINIRFIRNGVQGTTSPLTWNGAETEFDDAPNDGIFPENLVNGLLTMGAPNAIHLSSFKAAGYDNGVYLNWKTGFEAENLGYNIYREVAGKRTLVNRDIVAGSALMTGSSTRLEAGQSYGWWDKSPDQDARYYLEEMDINGLRTMHGPFDVHRTGGRPPRESQAELLSQVGRGEPTTRQVPLNYQPGRVAFTSGEFSTLSVASSSASNLKLASMPAVKMAIKEEGWYRVTQQEMAGAGLDLKADPRNLQLFLGGVEQPLLVRGDAIEFFATGQDIVSTDAHVYWLVNGDRPGKRVGVSGGQGIGGGAASFPFTVERRDRTVYFSGLRNGETENFFGQVITSNSVDQKVEVSNLDSLSGGAAQVEIALQGAIDTEDLADHQVRVLVNGSLLGRITFDGLAHKVQTFAAAPGLLKEGDNVFTLVGEASNRDISLVDYIRVTYQHRYVSDQDSLRVTAAGPQTIDGFGSAAIRVFDITDPASVVELAGTVGASSGGKYAVAVTALGQGARTLLALTDDRIKRPVSITANQPSNLKNKKNKATMVIIARREFFPTLEPLRALRESQGLSVAMVDIEDVFDEFSDGERTPQAVKDFLSYATTTWKKKPRFVLLAGHASLDPKNYLGVGDSDLVPTKLIDTDLMETASDVFFTDVDGDGLSELAIGRLPFRTADEAATMVSKIVSYESSSASSEALFVADNNDDFDFEAASSRVRGLMPSTLKASQINRGRLDPNTAKAELIDAINRGQKVVNYIGHGSVNQWKGNLLTNDDALALTNGGRLPLFVMMTCLNGYFHDVALDSLGESLLKAPRGGAIAVWASSGMTEPSNQEAANREFYRVLLGQKLTLGEAVMRSTAAAKDSDVRRTWVLLGDPAMRIK